MTDFTYGGKRLPDMSSDERVSYATAFLAVWRDYPVSEVMERARTLANVVGLTHPVVADKLRQLERGLGKL